MKTLVDFSAAWWHKHFYHGTDTPKPAMDDVPNYLDWHIADGMDKQRFLYQRFGSYGLGSRDPQPSPGLVGFPNDVSVLFGVQYQDRQGEGIWPLALNLDTEQVACLKPITDVSRMPLIQNYLRQLACLESKYNWKMPQGYLRGITGLMNTVLDIRGYAFLEDILERPQLARHLLYVVMMTIASYVDWQYGISGSRATGGWGTGNCSDTMISPRHYLEYIFPCDEFIASRFTGLYIHRDDRVMPYLEVYLRHPKFAGIEIGWDTPLPEVRKILPSEKYHINMRGNPTWVKETSPSEIRAQIHTWIEEAGEPSSRFGLIFQDIDPDTPDDHVAALLESADIGYNPGWF